MSLYRIKPLEWHVRGMYHQAFVLDTCYEMWKAGDSPFRWQSRLRDQAANATFSADSLEAGKAACEAHWRAKLAEVLEEVNDADTQRLDWLEERRLALNKHYGMVYGWKLVQSNNVTRLMLPNFEVDLHDSAVTRTPGGTDVRAAIDAAMEGK